MPSRKADPFHWDGLVRLTHWGVAAVCIGNLWLNEAGEEWHEWLGYGAMALNRVAPAVGAHPGTGPCSPARPHPEPGRFPPAGRGATRACPCGARPSRQRQAGGLGPLAARTGDRWQWLVPEHRDRLRAGGGRLARVVHLGPAGHDSPAPVRHRLHLLASAQQPGDPHAAPPSAPGIAAPAGAPFLNQTGIIVPVFPYPLIRLQTAPFRWPQPALALIGHDASPLALRCHESIFIHNS